MPTIRTTDRGNYSSSNSYEVYVQNFIDLQQRSVDGYLALHPTGPVTVAFDMYDSYAYEIFAGGDESFFTVLADVVGPNWGMEIDFSGFSRSVNVTGSLMADVLTGGGADDTLDGGAGADILTGGLGNDTFRVNVNEMQGDYILDFEVGDTLVFRGMGSQTMWVNTDGTIEIGGRLLTIGTHVTNGLWDVSLNGDIMTFWTMDSGPVNAKPVIGGAEVMPGVEDTNPFVNGLTFADADGDVLTVTLTVPTGSMFASTGYPGVTVIGSNEGTSLILTGSPEALTAYANAHLMRYYPAANQNGDVALGVSVFDGTDTTTKNVPIRIAPVTDLPVGLPAVTAEDTLNGSGLVLLRAPVDGPETSHFLITGITGGTLFLNDGVTPVTNGSFLTIAQGEAGLKFQPAADANGSTGFGFQVHAAQGATGQGVSAPVPVTVTVTEVNDAPAATDDVLSGVAEDSGPLTIPFAALLANDSVGPANESGQTLTIVDVSNAVGGTVVIVDGGVEFTPAPNFYGSASFEYTILDNGTTAGTPDGKTATGKVTFAVTPVAETPFVFSTTTAEDTLSGNIQIIPWIQDDLSSTYYKITGITGGTLYLADGTTPVAEGSFITAVQGAMGLKFLPSANSTATGTFQVEASTSANDAGLNGHPVPVTVAVTAVNDPATSNVSLVFDAVENQDAALIGITVGDVEGDVIILEIAVASGTVSAEGGNGVTIVSSVGDALRISGSATDLNVFLASGGVTYTPAAGHNGPVPVSVNVSDDGVNWNTKVSTISVAPVNDAPTVTAPATLTANEDVLTPLTGISFADPDAAGSLVTVTFTVEAGSLHALSLGGISVVSNTGGTLVLSGTLADLNAYVSAGRVGFQGDVDANGPVNLKVTVNDGGNTGVGGPLTDSADIVIDVKPINDAPQATYGSITVLEDGSYTFKADDFLFGDAADLPADQLGWVVITALPNRGVLTFDGNSVEEGQEIPAADIGKLVFTPDTDQNGPYGFDFGFRLRDTGGTENGGNDLSDFAWMSVEFTKVNDAPESADGRVETAEDTAYTFSADDFGFSDARDGGMLPPPPPPARGIGPAVRVLSPVQTGDALKAVVITGLPTAGTLLFDGVAVVKDQVIAAGDLGKLAFVPAKDANGQAYASFTFRVQDDGGVENGGQDLSAEHVMVVDVTPVNDAPVTAGIGAKTTYSGQAWSLDAAAAFSDVDGDVLAYSATFADGSDLPQWLSIDAETGKVTGTPPFDFTGTLSLKVTARDGSDETVSASFALEIKQPLLDGTPVQRTETTAPDGSTIVKLVVPVVTAGRPEQTGDGRFADIPLVTSAAGTPLLLAQLPVGFGLQASGPSVPKTAGTSLTDLIREIQAHSAAGSADQGQLTGGGSGFLGGLSFDTPLLVQTIVPIVAPGSTTAPVVPLVISGLPAASGAPQTALVIDGGSLPSGTQLQLENVNFAAIIGSMTITGGSGSQTIFADSASQHIVLGADDDTIHGGGGNDYVGSHGGNDWLYGDDGNDTVSGGIGNDRLFGGNGNDRLYGESGNDTLAGGNGNDSLWGGTGADRLDGGSGNDSLKGESGNDRITGGLGRDKLWGGAGRDVLDFNAVQESKVGSQRDVIYDFQSGRDKIDLRGIDANELRKGNQAFSWTGSDGPFLHPKESAAFLKAGFTGEAGQLRYANGILSGDTDGDRKADFQIKIVGHFSAGDVIL